MKQILLIFTLTLTCSLGFSEDKTMYVQAQSTQLRKSANATSEAVVQVNRGDALKVLASEGLWVQVQSGDKTGWISKILLSPTKPIGQAELLSNSRVNSDAKTSRRRTNEYAVSAATRGLTATERNRNSLNKQRSDRQAVSDLDQTKIDPKEVEQFKKEGTEK